MASSDRSPEIKNKTRKSPEQIRRKLYEDYEDSLFKLLLYDTAEKEGKSLLAERDELKKEPGFIPAAEARRKFSRQLGLHLKKHETFAVKIRILKVLNRAAVVTSLALVLMFTAVANVQAVRVKVLNLIMDIQPQYTSFQLRANGGVPDNGGAGGESPDSESPDSGSPGSGSLGSESPPVNWTRAYVPTYVPDGFKVTGASNAGLMKRIVYENPQGSFIRYMEFSEHSNLALDTENASVFKQISINGHEGTLVVKNSLVSVVWAMDGRMFLVQALSDEETALEIAEKVKYVE